MFDAPLERVFEALTEPTEPRIAPYARARREPVVGLLGGLAVVAASSTLGLVTSIPMALGAIGVAYFAWQRAVETRA